MLITLFKFLFKRKGWKIAGGIPKDIKKCVLLGAPHTSNWDFVWGMAALGFFKYEVRYLIKKELFFFPLKSFFLSTGGIPVDRSKHNSLVDANVEEFNKRDELIILFPPEGTRSAVKKWKTGFYYTALKANVPIIFGYLDYKKKEAGIHPVAFYPTGNIVQDFKSLQTFYKTITPCHLGNFNADTIVP